MRNSTRELLRSSILSNFYKWFTELTIQTSLPQPAIWNFSRKRLTLNLKTVKIWCTVNRLSINFSKTNFTILSTAVYVCTTWIKVLLLLLLLLKQHMAVWGLSLLKWIKERVSLYFEGGGLIYNIFKLSLIHLHRMKYLKKNCVFWFQELLLLGHRTCHTQLFI